MPLHAPTSSRIARTLTCRYSSLSPLGGRFAMAWWLICVAVMLVCPLRVGADTVEGFAEASRHIDLATGAETGLITEVLVREGEQVTAGQIVARLDTSILEASLLIAKRRSEFVGRLDAAKAERDLRKKRLGRLMTLKARGHASHTELDRAEADVEVAEAQVHLANEERELAGLECARIQAQIEQRRLRSPIDGVVVEVLREPGESTQLHDPRLLTLVQLDPLRVKFAVSIAQSTKYRAGDALTIELPEFDTSTTSTVEVVAPVLDAKSGTVQITCLINNSEGLFRSGMRCLLPVKDSAPAPEETDGLIHDAPSALDHEF